MTDSPRCGSCRFFDAEAERCRRYPPVPLVVLPGKFDDGDYYDERIERRWPEVDGGDWCGEHRPKEESTR